MNRTCKTLALIIAAAGLASCHVYRGEAIEGRVVDAETLEPLAGATVTAIWELRGGSVHQGLKGHLVIREVATDETGRFRLEGWGPRLVVWRALDGGAPVLVVSRPDYYFAFLGHDDPRNLKPPPAFTWETRGCSCANQTIALQRFDGDWVRYGENASTAGANVHFSSPTPGLGCAWKRMPKLANEIASRVPALRANGVFRSLPTPERLQASQGCR